MMHPSGYGEGQYLVGVISNVVTNADGQATFTETFPSYVGSDWHITATATSSSLNTSEFSQAVPVDMDDMDGDGMPKDYEHQHGFDPEFADGAEDADGDGRSNLTEMRLGSDSRTYSEPVTPELTSPNANTIQVRFTTTLNRRYRLERSPGLGSGAVWMPLMDHLFGNGQAMTITDPDAQGAIRYFYRLVHLP